VVQALAQYLLLHTVPRLRERMDVRWARVFWHDQVLRRLARVVPSLVVQAGIGAVPHLDPVAFAVIRNLAVALTVLQLVRTLNALLNAILQEQESRPEGARTATRSIKSYVQLGKLALALIGAIVIVAVLIDRSPLILLSGLGAMSAVLMLVFKDTILSFTAGVQLSSNDMLRVGDWIEMPQVGADGAVIDIALHTVKVQNWDKTITTIPTWRLMSESYRNWRGMSESGGRRLEFDFPPVNKDRAFDCVDVMRTIAESKGVSVAQIALAWLLHQKAVTSVIIGAKRVEQLDDNIAATGISLSEPELKQLDAVSALPREYPGWMLERQGEYRRNQLMQQ